MKKKLLAFTFLLIFAAIGGYAQGNKNIVRAYAITTKNANGVAAEGTVCFYKYAANGPGLLTYYYYNFTTKAKATASYTYTGYTSAPPNVSNMKAKDERILEKEDMKIIFLLLDKNNLTRANGVLMTPIDAFSASNELEDVADAAAATNH